MITNRELLDQLASEKFDVGIAEMYDICPWAIFHRIGVRSIQSAFAIPLAQVMARRFGIPTFASFVVPSLKSVPQYLFVFLIFRFLCAQHSATSNFLLCSTG